MVTTEELTIALNAQSERLMSTLEDLGRRLRQVEDLLGVQEGFSEDGYYGNDYYGTGQVHSLYQEVVEIGDYLRTNLPPAEPGEGPYRISFVLKDSAGNPIANALVQAYYSGQHVVIRQTESNATGLFTLFFTTNNEIDLQIESDNHNGKWQRGIVPQLA